MLLFNRVGIGYVFSNAFRSDDQAWAEFCAHLEFRDFLALANPPRAIPMRIGRHRHAWVGNCVGVGLSGGFIAPLEATAICTIEIIGRQLVEQFPDKAAIPRLAARFNRRINRLQTNLLKFIVMHYALANRPEPFWLTARQEIVIPDGLAENLSLWREIQPCLCDVDDTQLFNFWSYLFCLYAKGYFDQAEFPIEGSVKRVDWQGNVANLNKIKHRLTTALPDHRDLVAHIRGDAAGP